MADTSTAKFMSAERKSRILTSVLLSIGIPLLLFIVIPLELWCNNLAELNYHIADILLYMILSFLVSAIGIFSLLFFVPEKVYRVARGLVLGGGLMIFLQSNYLNAGISGLLGDDTQTVTQLVGLPMVIINALIWIVVVSGCVVASVVIKKQDLLRPIATILAMVVCLTQVVGIVVPLISTDFSQLKAMEDSVGPLDAFLTNKNMTTLATDRNVVVFVVDRMDEVRYTQKNLSMVQEYVDDFGGFTHFKDNISRYGHTYPSLAYMLTREDLAFEEKRLDYFQRVYNNNTTLSTLESLGYSINVYTDSYYGYGNAKYFPEYIGNVERPSAESVRKQVENKLALFSCNNAIMLARIAPLALKDFTPKVTSAQLHDFGKATSLDLTMEQASTDMKKTYDTISGQDFTQGNEKNFSMIHVSGCHDVLYNENWEPASEEERTQVVISLKNSLEIISEYIEEMKKLGVYDKSTIIITGDHSAPISDTKPLGGVRLTSLFVKPSTATATEPMQTSSAQVSHENLWATIFKSEGIAYSETEFGKSVFDVDPSVNQTRMYLWHLWRDDGMYTECEYAITGPGARFASWELVAEREAQKKLYA